MTPAATPPPAQKGVAPQGGRTPPVGQSGGARSNTSSITMFDAFPETNSRSHAALQINRASGPSITPDSTTSSSTPRPLAAATTMFSSASAWDQTDNAINGADADSDIVELDFSDTSALSDMNKFKALVASHNASATASPQSATKSTISNAHVNGKQMQQAKSPVRQEVVSTPSSQSLDVAAATVEDDNVVGDKKKKSKREKERERRERRKAERANEGATVPATATNMEPSSSSDAVVYMINDKDAGSGAPSQSYNDERLDRPSAQVALLRAVARAPQAGTHLKGLPRNDFVKEVLTLIHVSQFFFALSSSLY
jgi:hypothetical protein